MLHPRVLVAEDDAELRELLVRGLRRHDLDATGVGTGAGLLAGTEEWRPDAPVVGGGPPPQARAAPGVGTGAGLLAGAEEWRRDALVVDVGLPDGDGREVCQALRARGKNLPILFLTARDTRADRLSGFASGGDDYVT